MAGHTAYVHQTVLYSTPDIQSILQLGSRSSQHLDKAKTHSNIPIAKPPPKRTHRIPQPNRRRIHPQIHQILQRRIPTRRQIIKRNRISHYIRPPLRITILPNPPRPINICVMEVEERIPWASEEVSARVAADPEVAGRVHADVVGGEIALHGGLEGVDVLGFGEEVVDDGFGGAAVCGVLGEVSTEAARVVAQAVGLRVGGEVEEGGCYGTEVDGEIFEGTGGYAAGAVAGFEDEVWRGVGGDADAGVRRVGAVAAHGEVGAVEEGTANDVVGVFGPVDVGLVATITTFAAQGLLVGPGEVAVPGEEVALRS